MIVVPRVLTSVLSDVDGMHAKTLSLAFAERALRRCSTVLAPAQLEVSLAYVAAALAFVRGSAGIASVGRGHAEFFARRDGSGGLPERAMWIAAIAVSAACQRDMEEAGIVHRNRYVPDVVAVAKEAQDVVVACIVAGDRNIGDEDASFSRSEVRWVEAKWQLIHAVETAPIPSGS